MSSFTVVERPAATSKIDPQLVQAIVETVASGKAIAVPMPNGITNMWNVNVRKALVDAGLRFRSRHDKTKRIIFCWAESPTGADEEEAGE